MSLFSNFIHVYTHVHVQTLKRERKKIYWLISNTCIYALDQNKNTSFSVCCRTVAPKFKYNCKASVYNAHTNDTTQRCCAKKLIKIVFLSLSFSHCTGLHSNLKRHFFYSKHSLKYGENWNYCDFEKNIKTVNNKESNKTVKQELIT